MFACLRCVAALRCQLALTLPPTNVPGHPALTLSGIPSTGVQHVQRGEAGLRGGRGLSRGAPAASSRASLQHSSSIRPRLRHPRPAPPGHAAPHARVVACSHVAVPCGSSEPLPNTGTPRSGHRTHARAQAHLLCTVGFVATLSLESIAQHANTAARGRARPQRVEVQARHHPRPLQGRGGGDPRELPRIALSSPIIARKKMNMPPLSARLGAGAGAVRAAADAWLTPPRARHRWATMVRRRRRHRVPGKRTVCAAVY